MAGKRKVTKEDLERVINLRLSLEQAASELKCGKSTIWLSCKRFGIQWPRSLDDSIVDMRRRVLNDYRMGAKQRDLEFTLTDEEFYTLIQQPCIYCGRALTNIRTPQKQPGASQKRLPFYFTGIDRQDSVQGYTISNSVSCCKTCNYAKNDLTLTEFTEWLDALVKHRLNDTHS